MCKSQENISGRPNGWLNLSLGQNLGAGSPSRPIKIHRCNFCERKFYNPQGLGCHQNAHKRVKDAVRRYLSPNTSTSATNFMVQAHSLAHTPNRVGETSVARYAYDGEEAVGLKWPQGILFEAQTGSQLLDQNMPNLDLKL